MQEVERSSGAKRTTLLQRLESIEGKLKMLNEIADRMAPQPRPEAEALPLPQVGLEAAAARVESDVQDLIYRFEDIAAVVGIL